MTSKPIPDGVKPVNRYRLPGIDREGIAQLSLLETALWPLQGGLLPSSTFETEYSFQAAGERRAATVTVYAPLGLQSIDEYVLYGLLGISLSRQTQETSLLATPYWIIKRLGMAIGGFQYDQLRASLERLSAVAYQNTAFYNPVTQQHERVTFHFFSTFLPTCGRGGPVAADRAWKIDWSTSFFRMSQATGGTLLFDLDVYRKLTPASRRLFLKLKDRFWRSKRVFMNVDDLTINGLGFSPDRPLKKRKFDLTSCLRELLSLGIIEFGPGQHDGESCIDGKGPQATALPAPAVRLTGLRGEDPGGLFRRRRGRDWLRAGPGGSWRTAEAPVGRFSGRRRIPSGTETEWCCGSSYT